jgi:hypothetical protein
MANPSSLEPIREQILEAIAEKFRHMPVVRPWGGMYPAPPQVRRQWMPLGLQETEYPVIIVSPGSGSTMPLDSLGGGNYARFLHYFRVTIWGYVKGDDTTIASTWLQRLQSDVIAELLADQSLGGLGQEISVETDQTDDGIAEPLGGFAQTFLVLLGEQVLVG